MKHGLGDETLAEIERVLSRSLAVEKAILYGSRAKGNFRPGSDIDLALVGAELDHTVLADIIDEFEDGPLPYRIDLLILHQIRHEALIDHIQRVGVPLFERQPDSVEAL